MKSPDLSLLTDAGVPAKHFSPFSVAKRFNLAYGMSLLVPCVTRNLDHIERAGSSVSGEGSTSNARFLCEWRVF